MSFSNELLAAAERTMLAAGSKPKDAAAILQQMVTEHGCEFSVQGGLLEIKQTGTILSAGSVLAAHRQKHPRMYYGEAGEVRFKSDLAGDNAAKARYIAEHGYEKWADLPFDERSPGAQHVIGSVIPNAGMKRSDYQRLSLAEKAKLAGEIGAAGIEKILARK